MQKPTKKAAARFARRVFRVAVLAAGPTKHSWRIVRWWPAITLVAGWIVSAVGLALPRHLSVPPARWIGFALVLLSALLFRAAYRLVARDDQPFPDVLIDWEWMSANSDPNEGGAWLKYPLVLTSRERDKVVLDFELGIVRDSRRLLTLRSEQRADLPLNLEPRTSIRKELTFHLPEELAEELREQFGDTGYRLIPARIVRLVVTEFISGRQIELHAPRRAVIIEMPDQTDPLPARAVNKPKTFGT